MYSCSTHGYVWSNGSQCPGCTRASVDAFNKQTAAMPIRMPTKETNPKDAIGDTKAPLHLLSPIASLHWALAQFVGNVKYGAWNWRAGGARASVYIAAAKRHLDAYTSGETHDPTDGTHHLGNVMACCAILLEAEAAGKLVDDRPPVVSHRSTLEFVERQMAVLREKYTDKNPKHWTIDDQV